MQVKKNRMADLWSKPKLNEGLKVRYDFLKEMSERKSDFNSKFKGTFSIYEIALDD